MAETYLAVKSLLANIVTYYTELMSLVANIPPNQEDLGLDHMYDNYVELLQPNDLTTLESYQSLATTNLERAEFLQHKIKESSAEISALLTTKILEVS